ncbi:MAG TPA: thiaminase II, partial [Dehalococcoidia bacterium]|nr:thiaminase II [Dehalococcoidia bacterium]
MTVTQELRERYSGLWEQMVYHPFVVEMGEGTLPAGKF